MLFPTLALLLAAAPFASEFPVTVRGGDSGSFLPDLPKGPAVVDGRRYDAVIIGGGPAGLTAALYLSDRGKRVLLLEKEDTLGGLASGGALENGVPFNRGVAYWTSAYEEEGKILDHIGLGAYKERNAIPEPADSYLWNGRLYLGLWEEHTLQELPASFALFKHELQLANSSGLIPNQPFEESPHLDLDRLTAAEWIRGMPEATSRRTDEASRAVYERFQKDSTLRREDPMSDVIDLMDLYCRSALGGTTGKVSAVAFANFYISEIETRYTTPIGTGEAASSLERLLRQRPHLVRISTGSAARQMEQDGDGLRVTFLQRGHRRAAEASYAVFAAPLKFAPSILAGLSEAEPERAAAIAGLPYSHYSVHAVVTKGHPYRASFDTWTRAADYRETDFPDLILGRWMDPAIRGYDGLRDFKKEPPDEDGILTIYHPFLHREDTPRVSAKEETDHVVDMARQAVGRLQEIYAPLLQERWGTKIEVKSVETSRWPYSIHVARPGHFSKASRLLRKPYGRVFFANNNLGTPSFEEALFRGHCAANNILKRFEPEFKQETWTKCPLE